MRQSRATKESMSPQQPPATADGKTDLSPEEIATQITEIAGRIEFLRSYWKTNPFNKEVDAEIQAWLVRLQELARRLPPELVQDALGTTRVYLLSLRPRVVKKETIPEKAQLTTMPSSAPAADPVGTWTEIWYAIHQPHAPRRPQHPPGYIADGLQQFL